jgi:transposase
MRVSQKLCGYAGLCPSTSSSGGKTFQGKLLPHCNKWLRWAFIEAAWVAIGCSAYFGDFYKCKRALGKKPNIAILATARLMGCTLRSGLIRDCQTALGDRNIHAGCSDSVPSGNGTQLKV